MRWCLERSPEDGGSGSSSSFDARAALPSSPSVWPDHLLVIWIVKANDEWWGAWRLLYRTDLGW